MAATPVTLLTSAGTTNLATDVDGGRVWLDPATVEAVTGWTPKPEGLCRGDLCVPVRDPDARRADGHYDLARVAAALHRPHAEQALPDGAVVVSVGDAAHERAEALAGRAAPTVELTGLDGAPVAVPDGARRKRLLLAWSSW